MDALRPPPRVTTRAGAGQALGELGITPDTSCTRGEAERT